MTAIPAPSAACLDLAMGPAAATAIAIGIVLLTSSGTLARPVWRTAVWSAGALALIMASPLWHSLVAAAWHQDALPLRPWHHAPAAYWLIVVTSLLALRTGGRVLARLAVAVLAAVALAGLALPASLSAGIEQGSPISVAVLGFGWAAAVLFANFGLPDGRSMITAVQVSTIFAILVIGLKVDDTDSLMLADSTSLLVVLAVASATLAMLTRSMTR